jgi:hypothetical protein
MMTTSAVLFTWRQLTGKEVRSQRTKRQKAEAESRRQKAEGRKHKAECRRQKVRRQPRELQIAN